MLAKKKKYAIHVIKGSAKDRFCNTATQSIKFVYFYWESVLHYVICELCPTADGLGCELCNYHGTCYYKAEEEPTCECFQWYAGELCQINLKGKIQ